MISRSLFTESKKLRIFDFDDTLVKTKSFIYVTHSNGKKSKLTPGQYAVYSPKPDDEFDYSDFQQVKKPTEIRQITKVLRRIMKSSKGDGVYILTARSAYKPIVQYLKDIGFVNKIKVIALASADPKDKADWIEKMIDEKGYDDIYFADDSEKNVSTVKKMLRNKDVKWRVQMIKENRKPSTKLKDILLESTPSYYKQQVADGKKVFLAIQKMYPEIPKFPLKFSNLRGRGMGYIQTTRTRGVKMSIEVDFMMIDNSGQSSFDPDYVICHEWAHVILAVTKGSLGHTKTHSNLTYKLAKKFGLV